MILIQAIFGLLLGEKLQLQRSPSLEKKWSELLSVERKHRSLRTNAAYFEKAGW